jgi:nicotinamidase-related amidase
MSRTPSRRTAHHGALLVVDLQERLLAAMPHAALITANAARLARAARELDVPVLATEQNPQKLGPTVGPLAGLVPAPVGKMTFSACGAGPLLEGLHGRAIRHVTLVGVEAHVCVAQTALDLIDMGFAVQVAADAVASRSTHDWAFALRRLAAAGAIITTTEAVLFEWLETADAPAFKAISALVKDFAPPDGPPLPGLF